MKIIMHFFLLLSLVACSSSPISKDAMQVIYQLTDDVKAQQVHTQRVISEYDKALTECRESLFVEQKKRQKEEKTKSEKKIDAPLPSVK